MRLVLILASRVLATACDEFDRDGAVTANRQRGGIGGQGDVHEEAILGMAGTDTHRVATAQQTGRSHWRCYVF